MDAYFFETDFFGGLGRCVGGYIAFHGKGGCVVDRVGQGDVKLDCVAADTCDGAWLRYGFAGLVFI